MSQCQLPFYADISVSFAFREAFQQIDFGHLYLFNILLVMERLTLSRAPFGAGMLPRYSIFLL